MRFHARGREEPAGSKNNMMTHSAARGAHSADTRLLENSGSICDEGFHTTTIPNVEASRKMIALHDPLGSCHLRIAPRPPLPSLPG